MADHAAPGGLERHVARARDGDRDALEEVARALHKDVYALSLRFLWHPQDAEDATQEILIRVITGLAGFRGDSSFRTWVYRIACNTLLTVRRQRMETRPRSFDEFAGDLARGLSDEPPRGHLLVATSRSRAERFPGVLATIGQCDDTRRAAALYRAHDPKPPDGFISWLRAFVTRPCKWSGRSGGA